MTRTTPEQRADLARMLDAAMLDAGMSGPWREWGDMWIQLGTTRALIVAAVNALPDLLADLEDAEAEVESLTAALRLAQARATDAETEARLLAAKVERVRELHYAADNTAGREPICEHCHGAAGHHPCGCWSAEDRQPVCGHCYTGRKSSYVDWPCPTIRALDESEG